MDLKKRLSLLQENPSKLQEQSLERLRKMPQVDPREESRKLQRESLRRIRTAIERS